MVIPPGYVRVDQMYCDHVGVERKNRTGKNKRNRRVDRKKEGRRNYSTHKNSHTLQLANLQRTSSGEGWRRGVETREREIGVRDVESAKFCTYGFSTLWVGGWVGRGGASL
jgi:hypothetical protein